MLLETTTVVSKTIYLSLIIQIITTIISFEGLFKKLKERDYVLKEILVLEGIVQLIESFFYIWVIFAIHNLTKVTPRRYIDWTFSTPIMLISTIVFMKYQEYKENNIDKTFKMIDFFEENKTNIFKIFIFNGLMLLCGFLGEAGIIDKRIGIPLGFVFFYLSFNLIYKEYGKKSELGKKLFTFLVIVWGLYGVAAMTDLKTKNISYNILDIIAKNFYGLFIYYMILQISKDK
jgi:bacteriorhodopsin